MTESRLPVLMMVMFLGVVSGLSFGLHLYALQRLQVMLSPSLDLGVFSTSPEVQFASWPLAIGLTVFMCSYFTIGKLLSPRSFRWLAWASSLWMGALALIFIWGGAYHIVEKLLEQFGQTAPKHTGLLPFTAALLMWGIGVRNALNPPRLEQVTLQSAALPDSLCGLRIVQISDIHIGPTLGKSFLQDIVTRIDTLKPDLIVITGDLVDGDVAMLREDVAPIFELTAPLGVFFITGNHELISGVDPWVQHLEKGGITVLQNDSQVLEHNNTPFNLVGVEDWDSARFHPTRTPSLGEALRSADTTRFTILLAHQPKAIQEACKQGIDIQLSGHTHGGQIAPFSYLIYLDQPYRRGLYQVEETLLYVNEGTGYWGPPLRIGTRSEITELTLQKTSALHA